jgi:hypothetical protein
MSEEEPTRRKGPRPPVRRGLGITEYPQYQLIQLIRWIESDDQVRTEDELLDETMRDLGFRRHGSRVVALITAALRQSRR